MIQPASLSYRQSFVMAASIARRELRHGVRGFGILIACLALGVGAIGTVQSVSSGVLEALRSDGQAILGGDVSARLLYRQASADQLAWLGQQGEVAIAAEMRAMARTRDPRGLQEERAALAELKSVTDNYPLYGTFQIKDADGSLRAADPSALLVPRDGRHGALIEEALADRLGLGVGDAVQVGDASFQVRGVIGREPDKAGSGNFALGPRLLLSQAGLAATGLLQEGSLIAWNYQLKLPAGTRAAAFRDAAKNAHPDAGWRLRDAANAAPQLSRFIDRLTVFLTLVGLTALLVGGVGVGNAVSHYMRLRARSIAALKCLGAPRGIVAAAYLLQVLALACVGIAIGLLIGALGPLFLGQAIGDLLPIAARIGIYPQALAAAAAFGLLVALAFSLWPIGRAGDIPAAALFRDAIAPTRWRPRWPFALGIGLCIAALAALAIVNAEDKLFATAFVGGSLLALACFRAAGAAIVIVARWLPRSPHPLLRLAIANMHRPGNPTGTVILSLGLGLTVLVAIALIEGNFRRAVVQTIPQDAPSFFFIDIQPDQVESFSDTARSLAGQDANLKLAPNLRARIVAVNGIEAERAVVNKEHAWVLNGDRGVTYQAEAPADDMVIAGRWWPPDYQGPPLLAIYKDIADAFGIGPGTRMTINVLGRDIEADVALVRDLKWETIGVNFTLVFSPGALEGAPHSFLATLKAAPETEMSIQRAIAARFGSITAIRVRDALETVNGILGNVALAVRVTAFIALLAGALVLAGTIAADHRRRVYDAVVLKTLGAARFKITAIFLVEYGALGIAAALIAGGLGTLIAWVVCVQVMEFDFIFLPTSVLAALGLSLLVTLFLGYVGAFRALGQPAAPLLRNE
jgi:putative ABC transport system permease protein